MRIFIGYDPRQEAAFTVAARSALKRASGPLAITPLHLPALASFGFTRSGLTPFTYSRFLVPFLCGFAGEPAVFVDADVLWRDDPYKLLAALEPQDHNVPVWVRKSAPEFERCAVMVFNPSHRFCKNLSVSFVTEGNPFALHAWAGETGNIPDEWHHLVLYDKPNPNARLVHFTAGVPSFFEVDDVEHSRDYRHNLAAASGVKTTWRELMGNSRHVETVEKWRASPYPSSEVPKPPHGFANEIEEAGSK